VRDRERERQVNVAKNNSSSVSRRQHYIHTSTIGVALNYERGSFITLQTELAHTHIRKPYSVYGTEVCNFSLLHSFHMQDLNKNIKRTSPTELKSMT